MSITSYTELQSAITNWLGGRTDLTTYYADWITLFEAYAARKLRVRPMETIVTLTPSSGVVTLPSDYLGFKEVLRNTPDFSPIPYIADEMSAALFPTYPSGTPQVFSIVGNTLLLNPVADDAISLVYYAKNSAVSSSLNWLFTHYPDAYLNGALLEAAIFTRDDDGAVLFKARRDEIMDEVSKLNFREPAGMQVRVLQVTP